MPCHSVVHYAISSLCMSCNYYQHDCQQRRTDQEATLTLYLPSRLLSMPTIRRGIPFHDESYLYVSSIPLSRPILTPPNLIAYVIIQFEGWRLPPTLRL